MDLIPLIGGLIGTITGVSFAMYFRRKAKSPEAARQIEDRVILTHHWLIKAVAAFCLVVFGGLFAMAALVPDDAVLLALCFVPFVMLELAFCLEVFVFRLELHKDALKVRTRRGHVQWIPWNEVQSVQHRPVLDTYSLKTSQHGTIWISSWIPGLKRLFECLETHGIETPFTVSTADRLRPDLGG